MKEVDHLTVEVFRDADRKDTSLDLAMPGIDLVRSHDVPLQVIRSDRLLRVARPEDDSVVANKIRWPKLGADLNIVLTNRPLFDTAPSSSQDSLYARQDRLGVALYSDRPLANKIALIGLGEMGHSDLTVAHEMAHLLNVQPTNAIEGNQRHCATERCVMHPVARREHIEERVPQKGIRLIQEKLGYRLPEYTDRLVPMAHDFCIDCGGQLAKRAFFLMMQKSGKTIPGGWC